MFGSEWERAVLTAGSMMFRWSLTASSRTQKRVPSIMARTPVFLPGVARLSNSRRLNKSKM